MLYKKKFNNCNNLLLSKYVPNIVGDGDSVLDNVLDANTTSDGDDVELGSEVGDRPITDRLLSFIAYSSLYVSSFWSIS